MKTLLLALVLSLSAAAQTLPPLTQTLIFEAGQYSAKPGPKWSIDIGGADLTFPKIGAYTYASINYATLPKTGGLAGTTTNIGGLLYLRSLGPVKVFALLTGGATATSTATIGSLTTAGLAEYSPKNSTWGIFFAYQYSTLAGKNGYFGFDWHLR